MSMVPNKIKIRAIIFLCGVFVLSQAISLFIYEHNRNHTILMTEANDLAERISGIVNLAQKFPSFERKKILAAAETQLLSMYPNVIPYESRSCMDNEFSKVMKMQFERANANMNMFDIDICVRELDTITRVLKKDHQGALDVIAAFEFPDKSTSTFHAVLPIKNSLFSETIMLYLLALLFVGLVLAWYYIVRLVSPIERLASAAEAIGIDINASPMNEEGSMEIRVAARSFNLMQLRLQRLIQSQTEMFAAISHDLKSSLTRLKLRVELLSNPREQKGINRVVDDMSQMVHSIVEFVRGCSSTEVSRKVEICALVESLCDDLKEEGFAVSFSSKVDSTVLYCRPVALRRGIQNIINNAIQYGHFAEVSIVDSDSILTINIKDGGPGIPEDNFDDVFKPFFRLEKSRNKKTGGLGLGLSITQNIVHLHGGKMVLCNDKDGGVNVKVQLPKKES